jgi:hypothetical protein
MRIIGQGMYFQQRIPKNWGELPMGATLGDELGGVGYIGVDGSTTQIKFPTLSDDLAKILPAKIVLTEDVKAEYSTKQRYEYYKKTGQSSPSSWNTFDFTIPKGTELTLVGNNQYAPDFFYTDKTEKGYPIDVRFNNLVGKAKILPSKKSNNKKEDSSSNILGIPKPIAIGLGVAILALGGFLFYKKVIKKATV